MGEFLGEVPCLVSLADGRADKHQAVLSEGELDGLPDHVGGPDDRRELVLRRGQVDRHNLDNRVNRVDPDDLGELRDHPASAAVGVADSRYDGVVAVGQRIIGYGRELQGPSDIDCGDLPRVDAINGDRHDVGTRVTRDHRTGGIGGIGVDRVRDSGTAVDRHARRHRVRNTAGRDFDISCFGQQATIHEAAGSNSDCGASQHRAHELGAFTSLDGTDDVPKHIVGLRPVYQHHLDIGTERERTPNVENKHGIGMTLTIKGQGRTRGDGHGYWCVTLVQAGCKCPAIEGCEQAGCRVIPGRCVVVSSQKVGRCGLIRVAHVRNAVVVCGRRKRIDTRTGVTTERCPFPGRKT